MTIKKINEKEFNIIDVFDEAIQKKLYIKHTHKIREIIINLISDLWDDWGVSLYAGQAVISIKIPKEFWISGKNARQEITEMIKANHKNREYWTTKSGNEKSKPKLQTALFIHYGLYEEDDLLRYRCFISRFHTLKGLKTDLNRFEIKDKDNIAKYFNQYTRGTKQNWKNNRLPLWFDDSSWLQDLEKNDFLQQLT